MKIRLASVGDLDEVLVLAGQNHAESRYSADPLDALKLVETFKHFLNMPKTHCVFVATTDSGAVVGLLAGHVFEYFFNHTTVAQSVVFYVMPHYRGTSAAMKLLVAFRKWAEHRKLKELCVASNGGFNLLALDKFLRHLSFTNVGSNYVLPLSK